MRTARHALRFAADRAGVWALVSDTGLTPAHVQGLYAALERQGASARLRQIVHVVLRKALRQAEEWGMVPRNVCRAVRPPRSPKPSIQPLTPEQAKAFLKTAEADRLYALYLLAIATGARQGELLALQWRDVDLDAGTLSIRHTLARSANGPALAEPKTAKGKRSVDLPSMAVDALVEHRRRMLAEGHAAVPWVFPNAEGNPVRKDNFIRRSFLPLLARAGLPRIRFHDLRHTAATLMLAEGVHPKVVQERLGHATIGMTMDTYSHVLPSMQKEAASKMDRLLRASGTA